MNSRGKRDMFTFNSIMNYSKIILILYKQRSIHGVWHNLVHVNRANTRSCQQKNGSIAKQDFVFMSTVVSYSILDAFLSNTRRRKN